MSIMIRMAITGEQQFAQPIDKTTDIRVWELRLHFCQEYESPPFFGWVFFHEEQVVDDAALVSAYTPQSGSILFSVFVRKLRPPTQEEAMAVEDSIQLRHRSHLWAVLSKRISMPSLMRRDSLGIDIGQGDHSRLSTHI